MVTITARSSAVFPYLRNLRNLRILFLTSPLLTKSPGSLESPVTKL
jgi:hypothetical protein